jgi:hypothetical protein
MKNEFNFKTVKLKLNRLNLKYSYSEQTGSLTLGGTDNLLKAWIVWFFLPLFITLVLILMIKFEVLPTFDKGRGVSKINGLLIGVSAAFTIVGIFRVLWMIKRNTGKKVFSMGRILIINKKNQQVEILAHQIKEFDYVTNDDNATTLGELFIIDNSGKRHILFGVQVNERRLLIDDLNYFKAYFQYLVMNN